MSVQELFDEMEPPMPPILGVETLRLSKKTFPPLDECVASIEKEQDNTVVLVSGDSLTPTPVAWLWKDWLALKKLHILAGMPGQGKTTIAISMAAIITAGGRWPDGTSVESGNVIFWSGEDDPQDTLVPRLHAAGADVRRCHFLVGARLRGEEVPFEPAKHLSMLRSKVDELGGIKLLVVDPVVSAVTGDSHKNAEVRRSLQPLVELASDCNCAVLGITHFAKGGQGSDPAQRVVGSVAFSAVARVVLVAAKIQGEEGEDLRVLARAKSNIGPDEGGFEYCLEQVQVCDGISASRIAWVQAVEGSARELLTDPGAVAEERVTSRSDLPMLLWSELRSGPTKSKTVEEELVSQGYTPKQVRTAREKMGIKAQKSGADGSWYWALPYDFQPKKEWLQAVEYVQGALKDAQDAHPLRLGKLGALGKPGAEGEEIL